jgi:hypothetical protein
VFSITSRLAISVACRRSAYRLQAVAETVPFGGEVGPVSRGALS